MKNFKQLIEERKMKSVLKLGLLLIIFGVTNMLFAQSSANASANVNASLTKGLSITSDKDLDFGEIFLTGSPLTPAVNPGAGATFEVIGHPNRSVAITFVAIDLDNYIWAAANDGTDATLAFTPSVYQTGSSTSYTGELEVISGATIPLVKETGNSVGLLYLWLGGELAVAADQAQGDYTGIFTMNVAY